MVAGHKFPLISLTICLTISTIFCGNGGVAISTYLNRCWFEVDLSAIEHNINEIQSHMKGGTKLCSVLKGNGYGHGIIEMAKAVVRSGIDLIAVATLGEAMQIREAGIDTELLILGYTPVEYAACLHQNRITQSVFSIEYASKLSAAAVELGIEIACELKLDSGMARIGFGGDYASLQQAKDAFKLLGLQFKGVFSHFATGDEATPADIDFAKRQYTTFEASVSWLEEQGASFTRKHICNSSGTIRYPQAHYDYCRNGSLVVGLNTAEELWWDLKPAGALKAAITMIKEVKAGESVSYCRTYFAKEDMLVASLACGYADGYPRSLSNKGKVELKGQLVPVVGTVCMDQMMIDVTSMPDVKPGDVVTLYGASAYEELGILPVAKLAGSVYVELLTRVGGRIPRVYVNRPSGDEK